MILKLGGYEYDLREEREREINHTTTRFSPAVAPAARRRTASTAAWARRGTAPRRLRTARRRRPSAGRGTSTIQPVLRTHERRVVRVLEHGHRMSNLRKPALLPRCRPFGFLEKTFSTGIGASRQAEVPSRDKRPRRASDPSRRHCADSNEGLCGVVKGTGRRPGGRAS